MDAEKTYCNPIPLPDYPIGRNCYIEGKTRMGYRETADPTVLYEDGKWYLYPSCGMVYWSEDFITWKHKRMEPYDCGYAPTVVKHGGCYYLLACSSELYRSASPTGPFVSIGPLHDENGREVYVYDPMLFSDTDGSLYLYCGSGGGIKGARLESNNPAQLITPLVTMFEMNTLEHPWERGTGTRMAPTAGQRVPGCTNAAIRTTLPIAAPVRSGSPMPWEHIKASPHWVRGSIWRQALFCQTEGDWCAVPVTAVL